MVQKGQITVIQSLLSVIWICCGLLWPSAIFNITQREVSTGLVEDCCLRNAHARPRFPLEREYWNGRTLRDSLHLKWETLTNIHFRFGKEANSGIESEQTGSGKTSLIKLLLRSTIWIKNRYLNGCDIRISSTDLRSLMVFRPGMICSLYLDNIRWESGYHFQRSRKHSLTVYQDIVCLKFGTLIGEKSVFWWSKSVTAMESGYDFRPDLDFGWFFVSRGYPDR